MKWKKISAALIAVGMTVATGAFAAETELPEGKGKDVVETACTDCHSLKRVVAERHDEEGWTAVIREMIENGAAINPNDLKVMVDYLAKNFGPDKKVNVNSAGGDEIANVLNLTSEEAAAIVQYRGAHGKFKDLSELKKVNGLAEKIEAKKALIEF